MITKINSHPFKGQGYNNPDVDVDYPYHARSGILVYINPVVCPICKERIGNSVNNKKLTAELVVCSECVVKGVFDDQKING